jgi:hypothetical protein
VWCRVLLHHNLGEGRVLNEVHLQRDGYGVEHGRLQHKNCAHQSTACYWVA